jgi:beta-lactam-binding protein with PASTA domain/tRNA A-37 threonylcarbamoyl transferase component Bud32
MSSYGGEQVGRVLGGRYRLLAPVGTGASATVFQAEDAQLRRLVAVKVLHPSLAEDPTFLKRFRAEAQVAANLSHPNIMAVHDWGEDDGIPYLVSEFLAGGSLRGMLDRGRLLSPSQALMVALEAARGLDYAHRQGLVHRDIKPANLLFGEDRRLRVADFGLARALAEAAWTEPAGVVLGTARYASPEQAKGEPVGPKTDVYALALVIVESITGTVPFAADTTVATLMARIDKLMPVSAELGSLASVVERAGRPDPDERFTAGELVRALVVAAERLPRPAPLPLVPTVPLARPDQTQVPLVADPARRTEPADTEASGASWAGPAAAVGLGAAAGAGVTGPSSGPPSAPGEPWDPGQPAPLAAPARPAPAGTDLTEVGSPPPPPSRPAPPPTLYDVGDEPPHRKRRVLRTILIVLLVLAALAGAAAAALLLTQSSTPTFKVQSYIGLTEAQVKNLTSENGWVIDSARIKKDDVPLDQVFEQDPAPGVELAKGGVLKLKISDGPTLSPLPTLAGLPLDQATAALKTAGLVLGTVAAEASEDVPKGAVIRWAVAGQPVNPGQELPKGTVVDLVVSNGPAPRTVPAVVGLPYDQAVAALAAVRLQAVRGPDQFSSTVPAGVVLSATPPKGTKVERDSQVTLVVSKGPDLVTVPDVTGQPLAQAIAAIRAAGLVEGNVSGNLRRNVASTSPPANSQAIRGSAVNIVLG